MQKSKICPERGRRIKVRNLGMIFCLAIVSFSAFVVLGQVQASTVDQLQPASTITYNQELVVNATGRFDSVYIGKQGTGGVTFFNGTIINTTTNNGTDNPVTFGDNVRVDGILFRTEEGGNNPLKIGDTLKPQTTASYDLGTTDNQFRNAYFSGTVSIGRLSGTDVVDSSNILDTTIGTLDLSDSAVSSVKIADGTIATADLSDSAVTTAKIYDGTIATADLADSAVTTAKIADGTITGGDIASIADLSVNAINATGDLTQSLSKAGAVKALVYYESLNSCARSWTYNNSAVSCQRIWAGIYTVDFAFDIDDRYLQLTSEHGAGRCDEGCIITYDYVDNNTIEVRVYDFNSGYEDTEFMLTVY